MKLLSVAMPQHDVNICHADAGMVRYVKLERPKQEKRYHFPSLQDWRAEVQALWGDAATRPDDAIFSFDPGALPPALRPLLGQGLLQRVAAGSRAERLPAPLCQFLEVDRGWFASHHYAHALSGWMLSHEEPDVHIVIDGLGDGRPWSVYRHGQLVAGGDIRNGSVGWGIREAGKLLGVSYGHYNDIAGKLMGLQAHGRVDPGYLQRLRQFGFTELRELWDAAHWHAFKGDPLLAKLGLLDWAATVHARMGALLVEFFSQFAARGERVAYSGGVAQNVVWNSLLRDAFPHLLIAPHCSDEGLSLGSIEWLRREHGLAPLSLPGFPYAQEDAAVAPPSDATIHAAAQLLAEGRIVGWYQGHGEVGPRALGNRSILMDPRIAHGKALINRIKQREDYRPFGASVLADHFDDHFSGQADAFMLYACQLRGADMPAIGHVDRSSRVQLVDGSNRAFQSLLRQFHALTGCPALLNTSLNVAGKPIAAHPEHALALLRQSPLDALFIGDDLHVK